MKLILKLASIKLILKNMNYEVKYENNTNYSETDTNKYETECNTSEPMKLRRILNVKLILCILK